MADVGVIYQASPGEGALRQGELLSGLVMSQRRLDTIAGDQAPVLQTVEHPWVIVISQDCDLDWDFTIRRERPELPIPDKIAPAKEVPNVLFCEALEAETVRTRPGTNRYSWNLIETNRDERHHFLQGVAPSEDALGVGIPELCTDFKRYFTIPTAEVYLQFQLGAKRRCCINAPYVQHLCTRFCYFQSRVALPQPYFRERAGKEG